MQEIDNAARTIQIITHHVRGFKSSMLSIHYGSMYVACTCHERVGHGLRDYTLAVRSRHADSLNELAARQEVYTRPTLIANELTTNQSLREAGLLFFFGNYE